MQVHRCSCLWLPQASWLRDSHGRGPRSLDPDPLTQPVLSPHRQAAAPRGNSFSSLEALNAI